MGGDPRAPPLCIVRSTCKNELFLLLQQFYQDGARIEAAFRMLFHRALPDQKEDSTEIIVCHANVIRYFVCR